MLAEIKGIKKSFGKNEVLKDISFSAESGECIGILGGNGSGKSTLLSILAGILQPDGGTFSLDGVEVLNNRKLHSEKVGYVPQGIPLLEELSAYDNLLLWYTKKEMEASLEKGVLKSLGIAEFLKKPVSRLSGGMKKRLSIGCALAKGPPLMLLDEPSAALDVICRKVISDHLSSYKAGGGTVIIATHDAHELDLCDRWFIIKEGTLCPFVYNGDINALAEML
ncbi:MAG: ABC transporter ATP-binding protein [Ruminococcaceae bacterium]|nr:ABC transporter ATP-binding protein [Oscillospiraceae bacterium]